MMGDFATPAAANGSSICINTGALNPGGGGGGPGPAAIPKHSTVVERLRQRIEGCRRHHVSCESRYQQAHAEQLEIERRETVSLYQRSLEQRAKKSAGAKQPSKQPDADSTPTAEQRNSTLIALQETVKRKLDSARSPLNGEQNGICDGSYSPNTKRLRKEGGLDSLSGLANNVPPISPIHQMDIKPPLGVGSNSISNASVTGNGNAISNHITGRPEDLGKNGLNGTLDLDDGFGILKDMKQEPLDDGVGMESSDASLSSQNKLFSDFNLNDQELQELIDELANTVPEDDMQDLFNEDFEEKKEAEFTRPAAQTPLPQEPPAAVPAPAAPPPQTNQMPMGSPQVRPSSSGPQFATTANGTPPQQPLQQSPAVAMATGSPANCVARSPQTPPQTQTQTARPGNGYLMNAGPGVGPNGSAPVSSGGPVQGGGGGGPVPVTVPQPQTSDLSPAEQLKQMAAQQQQRAKLIQQKQQQSQQANWSPAGPPTSPYGGPFNPDKPNSPMMYPQAFNTPNSMVPAMAGNPQKSGMNNYLPQSHMNMISQQQQHPQQPPNNLGNQSALSKPLSYSNTKPLSHFSAVDHMGQRMTPPMANQGKGSMMPYMQSQGGGPQPAQGPMPGQTAHLSEEQKRMLLMKQGLPYNAMQTHSQDQAMVGMPRQPTGVQPPHGGQAGVAPGGPSVVGAVPGGYMGAQQQQQHQQAAMMKQMMAMEQEKRAQFLMEQQKQQLLREQRQQQQQHLLAEQLQQHLPRQMGQQQRNPYPVQQVNQFEGTPQEMAARNLRNARLLQQQQQMQQMQNAGAMQGPVATQPDMGMPYGAQPGATAGQGGMYPAGMNQMLQQQQQHPNQGGMPMPGHRQPGVGPGGMMASAGGGGPVAAGGGYGQNMLLNPALKAGAQPMAKAQAQRLQSMMGGGGAGWQQQQQQGMQPMGGRTTNDMVGFTAAPGSYGMPPGQGPPRMPKQHYGQGGMVDPRAMNPAGMGPGGGQMMPPHMAGQGRTNQPRGMMMPGMNQGVPANMATAFGQAGGMGGATGTAGGGAYGGGAQSQGYQRTSNQDLTYGYAGQTAGGGGGQFVLSDGTDLDTTDGWMEELFPSQ
ncbi:mastermind-like protein 3 isoform X1 [Denticeps clupeoides]|uniref:Neurogenic mastermind-like N-terminal domain-containing protein n=2 Tax=Denticeps clupeoides TaxID=299321 RepID=A0AAY4AE33_9TELE|nr:mastermind-like protein 3 isoform X1 [Denticeps clupeoides]